MALHLIKLAVGASDIGDSRHLLDPRGLNQAGYGYAGIVVAALARLNPIAVVFVSVVMGGLANAGRALQGPDFPAGLVGTLQGLLLVFTLASSPEEDAVADGYAGTRAFYQAQGFVPARELPDYWPGSTALLLMRPLTIS